MAQDIALFGNDQLPAHLQGVATGVSGKMLAGMYTGGNRIGLRGSRFRLVVSGVEEGVIEENYLDTILLNAAPGVSRVFYKSAYKQGENAAPTCYSADGIAPPDDVQQKQSEKCATCPQNVRGSKTDGGQKYKACGYFRRTVVMLAGDTEDRRVYKLDVKGQGVFGTSTATAKSLNDYIKMLESRGVDAGQVVTRITFDTDASVPKLLFKPSRYIDEFELAAVKDLVGSDEVEGLATVNMNTVDLSGEDSDLAPATEQEAPQEQEAAPATTAKAQPAQAAQRPVQAQKPAPQAAQRPAAQAAQKPQPAKQQTPIVVETIPTAKAAPAVQEVDSSADLESILEGLDL